MSALLVDALSNPAFYRSGLDRVDVVETHISWVFLAGDRAYKLKKPVELPFVNYGTRERRRHFCSEELRLNRRLAPSIYLGVRAVVVDARGPRLAESSRLDALDWVVEMRRIPPGATLADHLAAGSADVESVAATIAGFHASARVAGAPSSFGTQLTRCLDQLVAARPDPVVPLLCSAILTLHDACRSELETRRERGLVRECHGDLRAEHVVMGEPVEVFDCVEFDPRLREIDVAADLAFLVMDLENLGHADAAKRLVEAYEVDGGEPGTPLLLALFCAYRACVRALVASIQRHPEEAQRLIRLAWTYVWRSHLPVILAVCGPAAVGKTTLAAEIAALAGIPHLNSDITRKTIAGIPLEARGDDALYSSAMTRRVYRRLARDAADALDGAVVDATFRRVEDRATFADELRPAVARFVECRAPASVIAERASSRARDPQRLSDADASRALEQRRKFEPLIEIPVQCRMSVDTNRPVDLVVAEVEAKLARPEVVRLADPPQLRTTA